MLMPFSLPLLCTPLQTSYSTGHSAFGTWTPNDEVDSVGTPGADRRGALTAAVAPDASPPSGAAPYAAPSDTTSHPAHGLSHLAPAQPHTPSLAPAPRPSSMPDISNPDARRGQDHPQDRGHALEGILLPPNTNGAGTSPGPPASLPSPAWGSSANSQQGSATGPGQPASRHGSTLLGQLGRRPPRAPASVSSHASSHASHSSSGGMAAGGSRGGMADALLGALRTLKRHGTNIGSRDPNDRVSLQRITAGGAAPPPAVTLQRTPSEIRQHLQSQAPKVRWGRSCLAAQLGVEYMVHGGYPCRPERAAHTIATTREEPVERDEWTRMRFWAQWQLWDGGHMVTP